MCFSLFSAAVSSANSGMSAISTSEMARLKGTMQHNANAGTQRVFADGQMMKILIDYDSQCFSMWLQDNSSLFTEKPTPSVMCTDSKFGFSTQQNG